MERSGRFGWSCWERPLGRVATALEEPDLSVERTWSATQSFASARHGQLPAQSSAQRRCASLSQSLRSFCPVARELGRFASKNIPVQVQPAAAGQIKPFVKPLGFLVPLQSPAAAPPTLDRSYRITAWADRQATEPQSGGGWCARPAAPFPVPLPLRRGNHPHPPPPASWSG